MNAIEEWQGIDEKSLTERLQAHSKPVVLRGLIRDWPAVQSACRASTGICDYLRALDVGSEVIATKTRLAARGVMGYAADLSDFNFVKGRMPFAAFLDVLTGYAALRTPVPSVAAQCARIMDTVPGFVLDNVLTMLPQEARPNLWLGNALTVPVHHDHPHNMACVVAGRRRFTLFPPDQIGNLYIGPLEYTPSGAPISLVDPHRPDFDRFPRWRDALDAAQVAELGPGDVLYIPPLWWHQVESLEAINLLVNYWWPAAGVQTEAPPIDSLLRTIKALNGLPADHRAAWVAMFKHYLNIGGVDPAAHIPPERRGMLDQA